jgi:hypothetical protein
MMEKVRFQSTAFAAKSVVSEKRSETIFGVECLEEPQKRVPEFSLFFNYSLSESFLRFPTFT